MQRRDFLKYSLLTSLATARFAVAIPARAEGQGNILTIAYPSGFPDLDPSTSFSSDSAILSNCYETLTRYIPDMATGSGKVEPLLADAWESSADGLTWTFHLKSGVTFSDGAPFNAAAVKASIERTKTIGGGAAFIWWALDSIDTPDDLTVVMHLSAAQPMDLVASAGYAAWIFSPAAAGQENAWFNQGNSAGTGPYTITRYEPGQRCLMGRNPAYWGDAHDGQFEHLDFEVVEDAVLAQNMIESGQADFTFSLPYENLEALTANPDLKVLTNPSFQNLMGLLNTRKAPLDNPKVRQALVLSFPYADAIETGTQGMGTLAHGVIPPGIWGHDAEAPTGKTDLDAARALLAEAGVAEGLELTMTYATGDALEGVAGELWKANLAKIGITLNLQPMAWEAQWQLAKADPATAQDIFVFYWWPTFVTPYDWYFSIFHSEESPNFNLGYYANAEFDAMIDEANTLSASDRAKSEEMFKAAQRKLIDDSAAVFMMDIPNVHVIRADITGYADNPAYAHVVFADDLSR